MSTESPAAATVRVNGEPRPLPPGTTVGALLDVLGLERGRVAVELNRRILRRDEHDRTALGDGDAVEIVTFVGGG